MISTVISFFLGILSLHLFRELPDFSEVILWIGAYLIVGFILLKCIPKQQKQWLTIILAFPIGFIWVLLHAHDVKNHWIPSNLETEPFKVIGVVHQIPEMQDNILKFEFEIKNVIPASVWPKPGKVKLKWVDPTEQVEVGDEWQFHIRLKRPRTYANPGSMDHEKQMFSNRTVAEGYVVDKLLYHKIASHWYIHPIDRVRAWFQRCIQHALENKHFSGVIVALVVGLKEGIHHEQWEVLKNTGTAHLMAISGLHIGLMVGFIVALVRFFAWLLPIQFFKLPIQSLAAGCGIGVAVLYAILAGFSVPTQRSVVMITIFMASILFRRRSNVWRNYFLALLCVLLLDPLSTLSAGFWLSFGAVGIILYGMQGRVYPRGLWWRFGRVQWVVFLGLAPLTLAIFSRLSVISPLANMIAIPWVSLFVVPLSLLGSFGLLLNQSVGTFCLASAEHLMAMIWPFLTWSSTASHAVWEFGTATWYSLIFFMIGLLIFLMPSGFPGKGFAIVWILPIFLMKPAPVKEYEARVSVLDVGQGLAMVIETKQHVLIFDTGPKLSPQFDTGEQVVLPFLATRRIKAVNMLILSHGDNDHMGGAESILKRLPVKQILTSEPELFAHYPTLNCHANQSWEWDGVWFEMLHPDYHFSKKRNDQSCVLRVKTKDQSVLITGDIEAKSEKKLIERMGEKLRSTVLLVPHHGSKTSSTVEFIKMVNPALAIIPVGYKNSYGHPKSEIVNRYQQIGIPLLNSVTDGAITFVLRNGKKLDPPSRFRVEYQRYWHSKTEELNEIGFGDH